MRPRNYQRSKDRLCQWYDEKANEAHDGLYVVAIVKGGIAHIKKTKEFPDATWEDMIKSGK